MIPSQLPVAQGKTKYKYVYKYMVGGKSIIYKTQIKKKGFCNWYNFFEDIEMAAKAVDKKLLELGLQPVNGKFKKIENG